MQYRSEGGVADFIPDICADFFSDRNAENNSKSRSTETKHNSKVKVVVFFLVHRIFYKPTTNPLDVDTCQPVAPSSATTVGRLQQWLQPRQPRREAAELS